MSAEISHWRDEIERVFPTCSVLVLDVRTRSKSYTLCSDQIPKLALAIARGARAFKRISDPHARREAIQQLFSSVVFTSDHEIAGFKLRPQFLADSGPQKTSGETDMHLRVAAASSCISSPRNPCAAVRCNAVRFDEHD